MTYRWHSAHMMEVIRRDAQQYRFRGVAGDPDGPAWWLRASLDGRWSALAHCEYPRPPDTWLIIAGWYVDGAIVVIHQQVVIDGNLAHCVWLDWLRGRCDVENKSEIDM